MIVHARWSKRTCASERFPSTDSPPSLAATARHASSRALLPRSRFIAFLRAGDPPIRRSGQDRRTGCGGHGGTARGRQATRSALGAGAHGTPRSRPAAFTCQVGHFRCWTGRAMLRSFRHAHRLQLRTPMLDRTACALLAVFLAHPAAAQERVDDAMIARIRSEALDRSQAVQLYGHLTDVIGPRLAGTPAYRS